VEDIEEEEMIVHNDDCVEYLAQSVVTLSLFHEIN